MLDAHGGSAREASFVRRLAVVVPPSSSAHRTSHHRRLTLSRDDRGLQGTHLRTLSGREAVALERAPRRALHCRLTLGRFSPHAAFLSAMCALNRMRESRVYGVDDWRASRRCTRRSFRLRGLAIAFVICVCASHTGPAASSHLCRRLNARGVRATAGEQCGWQVSQQISELSVHHRCT